MTVSSLLQGLSTILLFAGLIGLVGATVVRLKRGDLSSCKLCRYAFPCLAAAFGVAALASLLAGDLLGLPGNAVMCVFAVLGGMRAMRAEPVKAD